MAEEAYCPLHRSQDKKLPSLWVTVSAPSEGTLTVVRLTKGGKFLIPGLLAKRQRPEYPSKLEGMVTVRGDDVIVTFEDLVEVSVVFGSPRF